MEKGVLEDRETAVGVVAARRCNSARLLRMDLIGYSCVYFCFVVPDELFVGMRGSFDRNKKRNKVCSVLNVKKGRREK